MDDKTDLTLDAMFARDENKLLMLDRHRNYRDEARRSALQTVFNKLPDSAVAILMRSLRVGQAEASRKEDWDFLERHERIFGKAAGQKIHKQMDPWAYMYGECCDCCGRTLNPLNKTRYGVCQECKKTLEEQHGDKATNLAPFGL